MRTLLFFWLLLPALATAQARHARPRQSPARLLPVDQKFGFRDVKLESALADHPEMVQLESKGSANNGNLERFFSRPDDKLLIGNAKLESITYYYYKGKLESIDLVADGYINSEMLRQALEEVYGSGHLMRGSDINENDSPAYRWTGKLVEVYFFGFSASSGKTYLSITSLGLQAKDKADHAQRTKSDF